MGLTKDKMQEELLKKKLKQEGYSTEAVQDLINPQNINQYGADNILYYGTSANTKSKATSDAWSKIANGLASNVSLGTGLLNLPKTTGSTSTKTQSDTQSKNTNPQAYSDAWANITNPKMFTPQQTDPSGLVVNGNTMPEISTTSDISATIEDIKQTIPEFQDPTADRTPTVVDYETYTPVEVQKGTTYEYTPLTYNGFQSQGNSPVAGVTQDVYDRANAEYQSSLAVAEADAYLSKLRQQLSSGKTSYTDELNALIDNYKNSGSFEYDPNSDMLYQNYLTAMQNAGQRAMKDTMGQAAALTGGYGSSYATAAANGAYNNYLQTANDNLVNFYNMAMDKYKLDQDRDLQAIDLTRMQDETEYGRAEADYARNKDYADTLYNREYTQYLNSINQAEKTASMMQNDYWNAETLKNNIDMANASNKLNYDKLNSSIEEAYLDRDMAERQFATTDAFRKSEAAREQNNWETEFAYQKAKDEYDRNFNASSSSTGTLSSKDYDTILQGGVERASNGASEESIYDYVYQKQIAYGFDDITAETMINAIKQSIPTNYTKTYDPAFKNNDVYVDNKGNSYTAEELLDRLKKGKITPEEYAAIISQ